MPDDHSIRDAAIRAELLRNVQAILPQLRQNAERTERERRIPQENLAAMEQGGLFRILVPRAFGDGDGVGRVERGGDEARVCDPVDDRARPGRVEVGDRHRLEHVRPGRADGDPAAHRSRPHDQHVHEGDGSWVIDSSGRPSAGR